MNVEHPAFAALESARITDPDRAKKYAEILLNQAMLIAGLPLENPPTIRIWSALCGSDPQNTKKDAG